MPPLSNAHIQKGEQRRNDQWYHIDADEGYLNASLSPDGDTYTIRFYTVRDAYTDQGYGKELLHVAKEHAKLIGAKAINSTDITSDESVGAMSAVFGHENLTSRVDPRKVASVVALFSKITLDYTIQDNDPSLRGGVEVLPGSRPPSTSPIWRYFEQLEADRESAAS